MSKKQSSKKSRKAQFDDARSLAQTFIIHHDQPYATSLDVAERFGRRHDNVIKAIHNAKCSKEFSLLNFKERDCLDERGKKQLVYEMTRDGFTFVVLGFTGAEAAVWREKYIAAFNWMEAELKRRAVQQESEFWQQQRLEGKVARLELTDGIQEFIGYAKAQGSENAENYYMAITRMEYRALFLIEQAVGKGFRDTLTAFQNMNLATAEGIAQKALVDGMESKLYYKDIFKLAKERVERLAEMLGKSLPGAERTLRLVSSQKAKKQLSL